MVCRYLLAIDNNDHVRGISQSSVSKKGCKSCSGMEQSETQVTGEYMEHKEFDYKAYKEQRKKAAVGIPRQKSVSEKSIWLCRLF